MGITRRQFAAAPALLLQRRRRPNLVVLMTDDHGPWATGMSGCASIATPNIDRLAREGVRFTHAFACTPVCSPSRMTWLTGLLPSQHGVQDWLMPEDSYGARSRRWLEGLPTWSEVLASQGYRLGMTGKWHMGMDDTPQAGFSFWATVPGGSGPYRDATFIKNGRPVKTTGFKEDRIGDFAIEFLDQMKGRREPFALLAPFYAPHTPYDFQPLEARAPYENSSFPCFPRLPVHPRQNTGLRRHHNNLESMRSYSALITAMDSNVGRILARLNEIGAREDTTVVFTADQGWNAGHHGVWGKGNGTVPFNLYEEAIGVPLIWNHPGRLPAGTVRDDLVSSYDFFPTLMDWLGLKPPGDSRRTGSSYVKPVRTRDRLFFEYAYTRGVRTLSEKLVLRADNLGNEYYDLKADPGETANRYRPGLDLERSLDRWFQAAGAPPLTQWRTTTRQKLPDYSDQTPGPALD